MTVVSQAGKERMVRGKGGQPSWRDLQNHPLNYVLKLGGMETSLVGPGGTFV